MISSNFELEDKLTYEELAPSLQDMLKILDTLNLIMNLVKNGTNGRNIKIDPKKSSLFDDDDFRIAKISNNQIMISDIDMEKWSTATYQTESNESTQIIPNRIFLYDIDTTELWYYQDWNNKWCIRKDETIDINNAKPGEVLKLDNNKNIILDSNFKLKRVVKSDKDLYAEARRNPKTYKYSDNDYNIYLPESNSYYTTNNINNYPSSGVTDSQALNNYYTLSSDKASNKLTSRTWLYNEGTQKLFFYKCANDIYELNTVVDKITFHTITIIQTDNQTISVNYNNSDITTSFMIPHRSPFTVSIKADVGFQAGTLNITSGIANSDITISATPALEIRRNLYSFYTGIYRNVDVQTIRWHLVYPDTSYYVKSGRDTYYGRGFYFYAVEVPYNCKIVAYSGGVATYENSSSYESTARIFAMTQATYNYLASTECAINYQYGRLTPTYLSPKYATAWSQTVYKGDYLCAWHPDIFRYVEIRETV